MIFGTFRRLTRNKAASAGGGFLLGYLAASPLKHPFAALAALGLFGEYQRQKHIDEAEQAARTAAVNVAETDPACDDPGSPTCMEHAKEAAVAAGQEAMAHPKMGCIGKTLLTVYVIFAGIMAVVLIAQSFDLLPR